MMTSVNVRPRQNTLNYVWNVSTLVWDAMTQPGGGVGGGGDASAANQVLGNASLASIDGKLTNPLPVSGTFYQATQPVSLASVPTHAVTGTFWQATQPVSGTFWQATQPVSGTFWQATQPISIAATVSTKQLRAATPTQTTVNDSATNVTLVASNANRLGATIYNDSSAILYLKLGATASTTSYTARVLQYGYYEVPFNYTGIIEGIWATDPGDGAARVTELSA